MAGLRSQRLLPTLVSVWGIILIENCFGKIGTFWQVTDFHYDANYSIYGNPAFMCHGAYHSLSKNATESGHISVYGNHHCDSPWALVKSAVEAMININPQPDFILWTGDSVPHVDKSNLDVGKVFTIIANISDLLNASFPNVKIYPTLGNHDCYPSNEMLDSGDYYSNVITFSHWDRLLDENEQSQFKKAGYYSTTLQTGLRLISLNTNLYYKINKKTANVKDPGGQFAWLSQQLIDATKAREKVLLMAHVPPGVFERFAHLNWMYPEHNSKLIEILRNHSDIILVQIYGHEHTDAFRILYNNGTPVSQLLMAPAVSPMNSSLVGVGANNPGIRLFQYNQSTGEIIDFFQYYLNITAATHATVTWKLEYTARKDLGLSGINPAAFHEYLKTFSLSNHSTFKKYLQQNTVMYDSNPKLCHACFISHVCSIIKVDIDEYCRCMEQVSVVKDSKKSQKIPVYMYYALTMMAGAVFVLILFVSIIRQRCNRSGASPQYTLLPNSPYFKVMKKN